MEQMDRYLGWAQTGGHFSGAGGGVEEDLYPNLRVIEPYRPSHHGLQKSSPVAAS